MSTRGHASRERPDRVHQLCLGVAVQIQKPQQRRNPVVTLSSDPRLRRAASLITNTFTASADTPTRSSPCQRHPARNRSATLR